MTIPIPDATVMTAFLLAMVRAGAWLVISPPFSSIRLPMMVKPAIAASIALVALPHVPTSQVPLDLVGMIGALVLQVLIGSLLGLVTYALFIAIEAAGAFVDMFGGIVLPPALDPLSENQVPMIGQFYYLIALALLFATGGYEFLLAGFVKSFSGAGFSLVSLGPVSTTLTSDLATFFVAALEIAAPVVVVLFCVQVLMGMLAKAAPQANVFLLAFPFQVGVALLFVGLGITVLPTAVTNLLDRAVHDGLSVVGL